MIALHQTVELAGSIPAQADELFPEFIQAFVGDVFRIR
jgi:hypothetical protein